MNVRQAKEQLFKNYPNLQRDNSVLYYNIINLFQQIEDTRKMPRPCKVFPIQDTTTARLRFTPYGKHGEDIQL